MRKITLLLILFLTIVFSSIAQSYQEVVYLKDGSILKGVILKQVPNDYLEIETTRGKIYTIEMYEVEKITKERPRINTQSSSGGTQGVNRRQYNNNQYNYPKSRNTDTQKYHNDNEYYDDNYDDNGRDYSYFPNRGYKGFIDLGFSLGISSTVGSYSAGGENRIEFSTSHGFLFNPYIFLGLGVGLHSYTGYYDGGNYYSNDKTVIEIPIFAHVRSHFLDKKVSPFADIKLGYSVHDITGIYTSESIGCRFAAGSRSSLWISLGYSIQFIDYSYYNTSASSSAISLKLGWDF